jgi:hypothetical protein
MTALAMVAEIDELRSAQESYDKAHRELMAAASRLEEAKRQAAQEKATPDYDVDY